MDKETMKALGIEEQDNFDKNNKTTTSNSSNIVAQKFAMVVSVTKIIGYILAFIFGLVMLDVSGDNFFIAILSGGIFALFVWFSTLLYEAIAEVLNLLQDIKNK